MPRREEGVVTGMKGDIPEPRANQLAGVDLGGSRKRNGKGTGSGNLPLSRNCENFSMVGR